MKRTAYFALWVGAFSILDFKASAQTDASYEGSLFSEVWETTKQSPYQGDLPIYEVNLNTFYDFLKDQLEEASERTLSTRADILPPFRKLVHPHGICMSGTWNITEDNPYTGYFKQGSKGLIVVRQSAASSAVYPEQKRILGFAGKIFPTQNPNHTELLKTANFFTIDNLGGTYLPHFRDTLLTNDITYVNANDGAFIPKAPILAAVGRAFAAAEKVFGSIITIRQVYQIAELGEREGAPIITPKWFAIKGQPGPRDDSPRDFRDELRLERNGGKLRFDIFVSSEGVIALKKDWQKIGFIELTEDTISQGCDERLHFNHPIWRNDLIHSPQQAGYEES